MRIAWRLAAALVSLSAVTAASSGPTAPPADGVGYSECGGLAPLEIDCSTGVHFVGWFLEHGILKPSCGSRTLGGNPAPLSVFCYAGVVESRVSDALGAEQRVRCRLVVVATETLEESCETFGGAPPGLGPVLHECRSFDFVSAATGLPGPMESGLGEWGCWIVHS